MQHFTLPKDGGLREKEVTREILHSYEKIEAEIFDDAVEGSEVIAEIVIKAIKDHSKGPEKGRLFKLGLSTGTFITGLRPNTRAARSVSRVWRSFP